MDTLNSALLELEAGSPVLIVFMLNLAFLCFSVLIPLSLPRTCFCFLQGQSHFNVAYMTYLSNATFMAVLDMSGCLRYDITRECQTPISRLSVLVANQNRDGISIA